MGVEEGVVGWGRGADMAAGVLGVGVEDRGASMPAGLCGACMPPRSSTATAVRLPCCPLICTSTDFLRWVPPPTALLPARGPSSCRCSSRRAPHWRRRSC